MEVELSIKNYRCFSDIQPARIRISDGFIAFIGTNNAGKSSILKFFYEFRLLFNSLLNSNFLKNLIEGTRQSFGYQPEILDVEELFNNENTSDIEIEIQWLFPESSGSGLQIPTPTHLKITIPRSTNQCCGRIRNNEVQLAIAPGHAQINDKKLFFSGQPLADLSLMLETCEILSQMFYIGPFRNAISVSADRKYYDISVGQAFINQWHSWKNGGNKKNSQAALKVTQSIKQIFEFSQFEINSSDDGTSLQVFINEKSYKLSELGSGLAQFFIVFASVAMQNPRPSFILIDEPELNLHASLQVDFLTTLATYATKGVLFATHNIGLARAVANQVYSVRKNIGRESEVAEFNSTPQLAEFLGELGYTAYKERGFDKILLVESTSDLRTIQQFLRLYGKEHQIVLLPMGGDLIINAKSEVELQEISRLSDNIFALIDSEKPSADASLKPTRAQFVANCEKLKITCHVLKYRSIENYFPERAIKEVIGSSTRIIGPYDLLKGTCVWDKTTDNWRIARAVTIEELNQTDLGEFLRRL